jgi:hypothetical protein
MKKLAHVMHPRDMKAVLEGVLDIQKMSQMGEYLTLKSV